MGVGASGQLAAVQQNRVVSGLQLIRHAFAGQDDLCELVRRRRYRRCAEHCRDGGGGSLQASRPGPDGPDSWPAARADAVLSAPTRLGVRAQQVQMHVHVHVRDP